MFEQPGNEAFHRANVRVIVEGLSTCWLFSGMETRGDKMTVCVWNSNKNQFIRRSKSSLAFPFLWKISTLVLMPPIRLPEGKKELPAWQLVSRNLDLFFEPFFFCGGKKAELFALTKPSFHWILINALASERKSKSKGAPAILWSLMCSFNNYQSCNPLHQGKLPLHPDEWTL